MNRWLAVIAAALIGTTSLTLVGRTAAQTIVRPGETREERLRRMEAELKAKELELQRREAALNAGQRGPAASQPASAPAPATGGGLFNGGVPGLDPDIPDPPPVTPKADPAPPKADPVPPKNVPDNDPAPPDVVPPQNVPVQPDFGRPRGARSLILTRESHDAFVENLTDRHVVDAMAKGIDALLPLVQKQAKLLDEKEIVRTLPDGRVIRMPNYMGDHQRGEFAIGVYALLVMYRVTGDERLHFTSKEMAEPIKKLCEMQSTHTYTLGLQASALSLLPDKPEFRTPLKKVRDTLIRGARNSGSYTYNAPDTVARPVVRPGLPASAFESFDNSNTQYGLLGMWAVDDAGVEVPNAYWKSSDTHWRTVQDPEGGWGYTRPYRPAAGAGGAAGAVRFRSGTASMTAAGVASLFVTIDHLDQALRLDPVPDLAIQSGIDWITKDFDNTRLNLGHNLYTAYGIERVGLASGLKYFGKYNWYKEGAASVLAAQSADGLWSNYGYIPGTSYALLFLARGRSPVVFTKLAYKGPWNARPRDVANLNRWLIKRTERYVNWQVVDMDNSEPEDWLDGPILVLTGHGDPKFNKDQIDKLRRYVQAGGLIFSSADGDDAVYTNLIKQKYAPAICGDQYEMRSLPRDHYAYNLDYKLDKTRELPLLGLSNGVREMWIHCPRDLGAAWQRYNISKTELFEIPANIYFYVSGRASLRSKLDTLAVRPPKTAPEKSLAVGRLSYAGNWDPEPGAWDRLAKLAAAQKNTAVKIVPVTFDTLDPAATPVVHLTGSVPFTLGDPQAEKLRTYLSNGGFIIVDCLGGNEKFALSARTALAKVLPTSVGEEIDREGHPVTTGQLTGGTRIQKLELRRFCISPGIAGRKAPVYEYKLKDRSVALLFEADVTSGLLGTNTWGIFGYTPAVSESLAWNAVKYATRK